MICPKCKKPLRMEQVDIGNAPRKQEPAVRLDTFCTACQSAFSAIVKPEQFFEISPKTGKRLKKED